MNNKSKSRKFPILMLTVALLVAVFLVLALGWEYWYFHTRDEKLQRTHVTLARNIERILFLDEVITMSARMAAATGDSKYEKRHYRYEPELKKLTKETANLFSQSDAARQIKNTDKTKDRLEEMEQNAFALIKKGKSSDALALLSSQEYLKQKEYYFIGMKAAFVALKNLQEESLKEEGKTRLFFFRTSFFGVIIVFLSWIFSIRATQRWENEHKQAEEVLRKEKDKAQKYLDVAKVIMVAIDAKRKVTLINKKGCEVLGYKEEEIIGKDWFDNFIPERIRDELKDVFVGLIAGEIKPFENYENPILTKSGEKRIISWHNTILKDDKGKIIASLSSGEDITEHKRMEEARRELEQRFQNIFNKLNDGILIADTETKRFYLSNKTICQMLGYSNDELENLSVMDIHPREDLPSIIEQFKKQLIGEVTLASNIPVKRKDGSIFYADITSYPIQLDSKTYLMGNFHDITERKCMEETLHQSEESLETIFSSMTDGIAVTDLNGKILRVNNFFCNLLGYNPEELIGKTGLLYYPKKNWQEIKDSFEKFKKGNSNITNWELNLSAKNGELISVSSRRTMLKDKNNNPFAVMAVFRDIRDMRLLQEQLFQSEKLSATGRLISGVAHELNNPLTGIIGYSEMLMKDSSLTGKTAERIKTIYDQSNRCKNIISNLLKFARKHGVSKTEVSINEIIDSTLALNLYEIESGGIKVIKDLKRGIPKVLGDLNQLQSVILNLTQNAHHALLEKKEGEKNLKIKSDYIDDKIIIEVSDTGAGISEENIKKIFDPFFTTKEVGKGTGLGLSISHGIIKDHGGNIIVKSDKGDGTTFIVELPALSKSQETH